MALFVFANCLNNGNSRYMLLPDPFGEILLIAVLYFISEPSFISVAFQDTFEDTLIGCFKVLWGAFKRTIRRNH